jgi:hypothetical protein
MVLNNLSVALKSLLRVILLSGMAVMLSSCDPQVYGSVGMSSSSWNHGGSSSPRMHGNISVGGRICC